MELLETPTLTLKQQQQRPPEMRRLPLHRLRVRREGGEATFYGFVLARLADGMIVQTTDRHGTPNRRIAKVRTEEIADDAPARCQPEETPADVLAARAYLQHALDEIALERH